MNLSRGIKGPEQKWKQHQQQKIIITKQRNRLKGFQISCISSQTYILIPLLNTNNLRSQATQNCSFLPAYKE